LAGNGFPKTELHLKQL